MKFNLQSKPKKRVKPFGKIPYRKEKDPSYPEHKTVNRWQTIGIMLEGEEPLGIPLHLCNETPQGLKQWGKEYHKSDQDPELIESDNGNHPSERTWFASGENGNQLEDIYVQYGASAARWVEHNWLNWEDYKQIKYLSDFTDMRGNPLKPNIYNACKVAGYQQRNTFKGIKRWQKKQQARKRLKLHIKAMKEETV
tara:strand:- start:133 stop:717 length:585 start_codon:yes stop_codon:yes gene_type:complete